MPATFHKISPLVWDRAFRETGGPAKLVAFYVWTCSARVTEGLFVLPLGFVRLETGLSERQVLEGLEELRSVGLLDYDADTEVMLDRRALRDDPLKGSANKRLAPAVRHVVQLPETSLKRELLAVAQVHSPDFAAALADELGDGRMMAGAPTREARRGAASTSGDPPKPLASTSAGPSRAEPRGEDVERSTAGRAFGQCSSGTCSERAVWLDRDDSRSTYCDDHRQQAFGDVEPLARRTA